MSEAEQDETSQRTVEDWNELEAELAEVRDKREKLKSTNNRLEIWIQETRKERDDANQAAEESNKVVIALNSQVGVLNLELQEMTSQLRAAIGQLEDCREELVAARKKNAEISKKVVSEEIIGILTAIEANAILAKSRIYSK